MSLCYIYVVAIWKIPLAEHCIARKVQGSIHRLTLQFFCFRLQFGEQWWPSKVVAMSVLYLHCSVLCSYIAPLADHSSNAREVPGAIPCILSPSFCSKVSIVAFGSSRLVIGVI